MSFLAQEKAEKLHIWKAGTRKYLVFYHCFCFKMTWTVIIIWSHEIKWLHPSGLWLPSFLCKPSQNKEQTSPYEFNMDFSIFTHCLKVKRSFWIITIIIILDYLFDTFQICTIFLFLCIEKNHPPTTDRLLFQATIDYSKFLEWLPGSCV